MDDQIRSEGAEHADVLALDQADQAVDDVTRRRRRTASAARGRTPRAPPVEIPISSVVVIDEGRRPPCAACADRRPDQVADDDPRDVSDPDQRRPVRVRRRPGGRPEGCPTLRPAGRPTDLVRAVGPPASGGAARAPPRSRSGRPSTRWTALVPGVDGEFLPDGFLDRDLSSLTYFATHGTCYRTETYRCGQIRLGGSTAQRGSTRSNRPRPGRSSGRTTRGHRCHSVLRTRPDTPRRSRSCGRR